jgi:BirA family transcriptional regulator, biotin operon repressor / biotin---[acetyl-CoA-carboxylase] ligase
MIHDKVETSMKQVRIHFQTIGSTNTWAKKHVEEFDPTTLVLITADTQTDGRGRFKRKWHSPPGLNIYATFCFFLDGARADVGQVPQLLALSTALSLESLAFKPLLKWPNDVLLSGKKVGGILCETTSVLNGRFVICGIGLNVNMPKNEIEQIDRPATSLMIEGGQDLAVEMVLDLVQQQFANNLNYFLIEGFTPFLEEYRKRSCFKEGDAVRFHDNQKIVEGFFYCLNADGSLTLRLKDQSLKNFYAGEFL